MRRAHVLASMTFLALAACGGGEPRLHELRSFSGSPEEFAIVPNKPLERPQNLSELPAPTPGGANRTDQTPQADAVAAMGGNPAAISAGGIPASDGALVQHASRFGRDATIRQELAQADAEFRQRKSRFSWQLLQEDKYNRAYSAQSLDAYEWLERYRAAGARTPSAPPPAR
ncbi:DUF3035 domain-containing protein [Allosediminivita pacifica]|uniref:Beta-barrel assembly complex subunit BamF n=1 Tax=Allosediminivita pacifica TaxID=1267769 RepID=A0A2T6B9X6_9RHOB|nr:DUF3035 domain-containing protein [Allosediminivita pacifica]PTX52891.1 beta-barrel assembly complex subunit BamF [Allosediminivita pacifica]GGA94826.1 hypothetical protein GCM10011324_01630 [Allosediminivita pacifica]